MKFDRYAYWTSQPPEPSPGCLKWQEKIKCGFKRNARISAMGYDEACEFFGVYVWEYFNVLQPLFKEHDA